MLRTLLGSLAAGAWALTSPPRKGSGACICWVLLFFFFPSFLAELCRGHVWSSESPLAPHIPHVAVGRLEAFPATAPPAPRSTRARQESIAQQAEHAKETAGENLGFFLQVLNVLRKLYCETGCKSC